MATWAMRQRYAWIDAKLAAGETFTREDISRAFTVTKQTASATVGEYRALQPDALRYDACAKVFCRSDWGAPTMESWKARADALQVALQQLTFAARTSGGTSGPDEFLMQACERAEAVVARAAISKVTGSSVAGTEEA